MLDEGVYTTVSDIAEAERINRSYVSRVLRLTLVAPDVVEDILAGTADHALVLGKLERPLPPGWEEQRRLLGHARPDPTFARGRDTCMPCLEQTPPSMACRDQRPPIAGR
jgi:hypothetical protein